MIGVRSFVFLVVEFQNGRSFAIHNLLVLEVSFFFFRDRVVFQNSIFCGSCVATAFTLSPSK